MKISGWGKYPCIDAVTRAPRSLPELIDCLQHRHAIARGNGRAYGDSAISATNTIEMKHFDRIHAFDPSTGQLIAEAGVLLADVLTAFGPKGWFPRVTPGTKFVTLGGMVASDVHGKNHHKEGSFSRCIDWLEVITGTGELVRCSRTENSALFNWTVGGMGLTGIIFKIAFRLRPIESSWIKQTTLVAQNLEQAFEAFERSMDATYSVAWIDCLAKGKNLGRSLVTLGEHAAPRDLPKRARHSPLQFLRKTRLTIPFDFPSFVLNKYFVQAFNALYFWLGALKPHTALVNWESYFYPLDRIQHWNKIYGRKGFAQFQCVIPLDRSLEGMSALLNAISESGSGSFLAVLKRFGEQSSGLSFPMSGYTLALDFPISDKTLALMTDLDAITMAHGGRFYLAKDSRMSAETFNATEPRREAFLQFVSDTEGKRIFSSEQAKRLGL